MDVVPKVDTCTAECSHKNLSAGRARWIKVVVKKGKKVSRVVDGGNSSKKKLDSQNVQMYWIESRIHSVNLS